MTTDNTHETVDIVAEIIGHLSTYMHFASDDQPLALALWTIHTHTFNGSFPRTPWVTPYLYVNSSGPACGKTLLIDLLEGLVLNPERAGSMSAAAMYRLIESYTPTMLVDEVDTIWSGKSNEDLRNTLNTGYKHGGYTVRAVGGEAVKYSTFSPKLLAGIRDEKHQIPETVRTRSIPITLQRKPSDAKTEIYYSFRAGPRAEELAETIAAWVTVNAEEIIGYIPEPVEGMGSRAFEISMPLLQIARVAGCEDAAAMALSRLLAPEPEPEDDTMACLRIIKEVFGDRDKVHTAELCSVLGYNGRHLSGKLRPLGIAGNNTMQIGNRVAKGYWKYQFVNAWERYGI